MAGLWAPTSTCAPWRAWLFRTLSAISTEFAVWFGGSISVDEVRTPVEGLVDVGLRVSVDLYPTALANLHVPRLSGGVFVGVTDVLSVVTCQGPRILLGVLCVSGGGSLLVPASSGYTWIFAEFHAVHWDVRLL